QVRVSVTPPPVSADCVGSPDAPVVVPTSPGVCGAAISGALAGACTAAGTPIGCTFDGAPAETLGPGDHAVIVVAAAGSAAASCTSYLRGIDRAEPVPASPHLEVAGAGRP